MDSHLSGGAPWMWSLPPVPSETPLGLANARVAAWHLFIAQTRISRKLHVQTFSSCCGPCCPGGEIQCLRHTEMWKCWRNPDKGRCTMRAVTTQLWKSAFNLFYHPPPLSVTAAKKIKYGCSNTSEGPFGELTMMTLHVDSPPHRRPTPCKLCHVSGFLGGGHLARNLPLRDPTQVLTVPGYPEITFGCVFLQLFFKSNRLYS